MTDTKQNDQETTKKADAKTQESDKKDKIEKEQTKLYDDGCCGSCGG